MSKKLELKILHEDELKEKVGVVVGTRPGIVMFSPIIRELECRKMDFFVIHTGQHYSYNMDGTFFEELNLKKPQYKFDTVQYCKLHGEQTAEMLKNCEKALIKESPKIVLVGGDANTNLAGALAARKLRIKVGHVEAGERSYDWRMPEEHNRRMIDHISDCLFVTNKKGKENLLKENIQGNIFITGNTIVDAVYQNSRIAEEKSQILKEFELKSQNYFLLTLHREENVDSKKNLKAALQGIEMVLQKFDKDIIFLAHPRTQNRIKEFNLEERAKNIKGLEIKDAVGYLDFLKLLANAELVFTDSGGVQQESCILKVPCVTLRDNTEWVETLDINANILSGVTPQNIVESVEKMLKVNRNWENPFGDGTAAKKIVDIVEQEVLDSEN